LTLVGGTVHDLALHAHIVYTEHEERKLDASGGYR
jgi:hypothetical protein